MRYVALIIILLASIYNLGYIKNNWKKKNRFGAIGVLLLVVISIVLPVFIMFIR